MQATKCKCGAVTVEIEGESYSMTRKTFREKFPGQRCQRGRTVYNCNRCCNGWAIDACGCGSGKMFGKCKNGLSECSRPAQSIEEHIVACYCDKGDGWG